MRQLVWCSLIILTMFGCVTAKERRVTHEKVAFTRAATVEGEPQIWIMNDDGSGQYQLDLGGANNTEPAWSPDGNKLAFTSWRDGNVDLYLADIVASGDGILSAQKVHKITTHANDDWSPNFSPTCSMLAFAGNRVDTKSYNIYTLDLGTNQVTRLTTWATNEASPSWSPDGTKIAFMRDFLGASRKYAPKKVQYYDWEIFVIDVSTKQETRLTTNNTQDMDPSWTPDGKIIFSRKEGNRQVIYTMDATDSNNDGQGDHLSGAMTNPGADEYDVVPRYSPTGTQFGFTRRVGEVPADIWTKDTQNNTAEINRTNSGQHEVGPVWRIAITCGTH